MEAEVVSQSHGCRQQQDNTDLDARLQRQKTTSTSASITFSKELIKFSLYGKIRQNSKRPWNEALSSKIAEVQDSFKNIPPTLYFSPSSITYDGIGVYAAEILPKGTLLGPYFGRTVHKEYAEEETHEWLWEVYQEASLAYFIDASDPKYGNWMNFIQCARNQEEQNLKALQYNGYLYFESVREVEVGEELLVWYDDLQYDIYMGIPVGHKGKTAGGGDEETVGAGSSRIPPRAESYPSSRPSSGNSEESMMSSCPPATTASGGGQRGPSSGSDTTSASTDDSGIDCNPGRTAGGGSNSKGPGLISRGIPQSLFPSHMDTCTTAVAGHQDMTGGGTLPSFMMPVTRMEQCTSQGQQQQYSAIPAAAVSIIVSGDNVPHKMIPAVTVPQPSEILTHSASVSGLEAASSPYHVATPIHQGISPRSKVSSFIPLWPSNSLPGGSTSTEGGGGGEGEEGGEKPLYGMFRKTHDNRWQCIKCMKLFSSQGSLRAHARIHTGERPYQCQYCMRTFCQASTLRSHERLHTGEKPYKCEHCGRAFTQSAGLRSHLKTHRYDS